MLSLGWTYVRLKASTNFEADPNESWPVEIPYEDSTLDEILSIIAKKLEKKITAASYVFFTEKDHSISGYHRITNEHKKVSEESRESILTNEKNSRNCGKNFKGSWPSIL